MADNQTSLASTVEELLESMAFLFLDPAELDEFDGYEGAMSHARVTFRGDLQGALQVFMDDSKATELAANMLGEDSPEEVTDEQRADALKELANVLCGHAITVEAGDMVSCEISSPSAGSAPVAEVFQAADSAHALIFNCDETPLVVVFEVG